MVKHRRGKKKGGGIWKTMKHALGFKSKKTDKKTRKYWKNNSSDSDSRSISQSPLNTAVLQFNRKKDNKKTKKSIFDNKSVKGKLAKRKTATNPLLEEVLSSKRKNTTSRSSSRSSSSSPNTLYKSFVSKKVDSYRPPLPPSKASGKFITIINEEKIRNSTDIPVTKLELSNGSSILVNDIESIEIIGFDIAKGTIDINIQKTIENTHNLQKEKHIRGIRIKNDILLKNMKSLIDKELEEFVKIRDMKYPKSKEISGQYTKEKLDELKEKFKNAVELKN